MVATGSLRQRHVQLTVLSPTQYGFRFRHNMFAAMLAAAKLHVVVSSAYLPQRRRRAGTRPVSRCVMRLAVIRAPTASSHCALTETDTSNWKLVITMMMMMMMMTKLSVDFSWFKLDSVQWYLQAQLDYFLSLSRWWLRFFVL